MSHAMHARNRVAVVGAGAVGLPAGWSLQGPGSTVTVWPTVGGGAGSSWGTAGWPTPGLGAPLPGPSGLRYGIKAVLSPSSPVYIPPTLHWGLLTFLARFARNSTTSRWQQAMDQLVPINGIALDCFDELADGGVAEPTHKRDQFIAAL